MAFTQPLLRSPWCRPRATWGCVARSGADGLRRCLAGTRERRPLLAAPPGTRRQRAPFCALGGTSTAHGLLSGNRGGIARARRRGRRPVVVLEMGDLGTLIPGAGASRSGSRGPSPVPITLARLEGDQRPPGPIRCGRCPSRQHYGRRRALEEALAWQRVLDVVRLGDARPALALRVRPPGSGSAHRRWAARAGVGTPPALARRPPRAPPPRMRAPPRPIEVGVALPASDGRRLTWGPHDGSTPGGG